MHNAVEDRVYSTSMATVAYDPNARDADGDGIVQEGTIWERPVGTQIADRAVRGAAGASYVVPPPRQLPLLSDMGLSTIGETMGTISNPPG